MSALAFIAGILCILLPETRFMPTLENVNQVPNVVAKEAEKESDIPEEKDRKEVVIHEPYEYVTVE